MRILVAGATGFIGRNLAARLVKENHDVICGGRSFGKLDPLLEKTQKVRLDLEDKEAILGLVREKRPDAVYHCAALVESSRLDELRRVNVEGTRNLLDACRACGVKRVIYLSSVAAVSGNREIPLTEDLPYKATNPYGQSKLEAEKVAVAQREKGLEIAILRPCMVYGESEPHGLPYLVKALSMRLLPVFGEGNNRLHLVCVDNVVDVMVLCLSKEEAYEGTYFIADREALSVKELLNYMAEILNVKPPIVVSRGITRILCKLPLVGRRVSFFLKDRVYSIERLKEKLGYVPKVSVYDGLKKALAAYKKRR